MIIIGDVPVLPGGFGPSLYSKKGFAWYKRLADTVHGEGCLLCAQLHQSDSNFKGMLKYVPAMVSRRVSPDELRELMNRNVGPYISGLPEERLREISSAFGPAAELAAEAGFDMVQVHGDRMCGSLSSSCSTAAATATEAARRTGPALPWRRCPPSAAGCRNCP